jgi:hypothetical protein
MKRLDRDFLSFFPYTSGYTFPPNEVGDPDPGKVFPARPMLFDPGASWHLIHQIHRMSARSSLTNWPDQRAGSGGSGRALAQARTWSR